MKPYYEKDGITIYHGDCLEIMPQLEPVDLVLTDPPYGINYDRSKKHRYCKTPQNIGDTIVRGDSKPFDPNPLLVFKQLILWGANCYASRLPDSKTWLIWHKTLTNNEKGQTADCELAWSNCISRSRYFSYLWAGYYRQGEQGKYYHPTQKPIALMKWCMSLVRNSQTILDPFMGSGTTLIAAKELGKKAIGIELEEKYCEIAVKRLNPKESGLTIKYKGINRTLEEWRRDIAVY